MKTPQLAPQHEEPFRETGKFKPIPEIPPPQTHAPPPHFQIRSLQPICCGDVIAQEEGSGRSTRWWRIYFEDTPTTLDPQDLLKRLEEAFEWLLRSEQLEQHRNAQVFVNVAGLLAERVVTPPENYCSSSLDYRCVVVRLREREGLPRYVLDCFEVRGAKQGGDFTAETEIRVREEYVPYYLVCRDKLLLVRDPATPFPSLQLTDHNLEETATFINASLLVVKNLSPRIVAIKFQEDAVPRKDDPHSRNTEPLHLVVPDPMAYQSILYRINRIKYAKYRVEESDGKDWHSFELKAQSRIASKTTPEKLKQLQRPQMPSTIINKMSALSTVGAEQSRKSQKKSSNKVILAQPKHLKISQRVITNPKESNLVPSQLDYPVSMKDDREKENPYFDEFENLLYEEQGPQEKQLALNDSFEEFEKKQHSEKNREIIMELNKRKEKESEEKKLLDTLKDRIKTLIAQEKDWISKNLKLKLDIKKFRNAGSGNEQTKEIEDIRLKIGELKNYERKLIDDLRDIRNQNNIEALVFENHELRSSGESSQSQRNNEPPKFTPNLAANPNSTPPPNNASPNMLTTSIRSNGNNLKQSGNLVVSPLSGSKSSSGSAFNVNQTINQPAIPPYKPNYNLTPFNPHYFQPNPPLNIYSTVPTQSFIHPFPNSQPPQHLQQPQQPQPQQPQQPNYPLQNPNRPPPNLHYQNDYGYQPRHHPAGPGFTSAIYNSGSSGFPVGSPMASKKPSLQIFPTSATKN